VIRATRRNCLVRSSAAGYAEDLKNLCYNEWRRFRMLNLASDFSAGRKLQELVTDLEKQGITSESCLMRVNASL
jgi:hypothetical protein